MSTNLQKSTAETALQEGFTLDQVNLIKKMVAPGATDDELKLFLHHAKRSGLDPLSKQIYFLKLGGKATFITSIDGYRTIAERTQCYAGSDDAVFESIDGDVLIKATVTIWKLVGGIRCPFTASAHWNEYCPAKGRDQMWTKMPHTMLAKCAEGLALRKAFPNELGGMYTKDEMDQADRSSPNIQSAPTLISQQSIIDSATGEVVEDKLATIGEVDRMYKAFEQLGVHSDAISALAGKNKESLTESDINKLRGYYYQKKAEK